MQKGGSLAYAKWRNILVFPGCCREGASHFLDMPGNRRNDLFSQRVGLFPKQRRLLGLGDVQASQAIIKDKRQMLQSTEQTEERITECRKKKRKVILELLRGGEQSSMRALLQLSS